MNGWIDATCARYQSQNGCESVQASYRNRQGRVVGLDGGWLVARCRTSWIVSLGLRRMWAAMSDWHHTLAFAWAASDWDLCCTQRHGRILLVANVRTLVDLVEGRYSSLEVGSWYILQIGDDCGPGYRVALRWKRDYILVC